MIVMKFGGTSVENAPSMRNVLEIVRRERNRQPIVVVSAIANATNALLQAAQLAFEGSLDEAVSQMNRLHERHVELLENLIDDRPTVQQLLLSVKRKIEELRNLCSGIAILGELTNRSKDVIASAGELLSSRILSEALRTHGVPSELVDARTFIITDNQFSSASPRFDLIHQRIREHLMPRITKGVIVTQGFVGATVEGTTTTLGRGGSDYTASIIGASVGAEEIQIWTDVDGVLTADPRIAPAARKLRVISFREASELAYFGAKVLHPSTILPAVKKNIPVVVLNSKRPNSSGTRIVGEPPATKIPVKSVACKKGITVLNIQSTRMLMAYGFLESIFSVFRKHSTAVDLVSTSEVAVSLTIDNTSRLESIAADLRQFADVTVREQMGILCIVGDQMRSTAGIAEQIFHALGDINATMVSQGASEINMSIVVDESQLDKAVRRVHEHFFEQGPMGDLFDPVGED